MQSEKKGNKIEKLNAKLINNAIFGQPTQNPIKKVDIKFINSTKNT